MQRVFVSFCGGVVGAIINILFLLFAPDLEMNVYLSTGFTWIAIGILIASCNFKLNGALKGMIVALLVSVSSLIYMITSSLSGAAWTLVNTFMVGAIIGYVIDTIISKSKKG